MATLLDPTIPSPQEAELARASARELAELLERDPRDRIRVRVADDANGADVVLPASALQLLGRILAEMAQGNAVTLMPHHAELTTQQAADALDVSRPHLVKLLEGGAIPHRKVGTHRRVRFEDVLAYKRTIDAQRRETLDELAVLSQELGLDEQPLTHFTALYDANVLYPASIRDLLMRLAMTGLYRAKWTNEIHEEWIRNVLTNRPDLRRDRLERVRTLMNRHAPDCLVENYQGLIPALELPDPDDRHVLAAAIAGHVDVIVTFDLADFPPEELANYGVEAQHPDAFVMHLVALDSYAVLAAVRQQRAALKRPPVSPDDLTARFRRNGLPEFAGHLETALDLI